MVALRALLQISVLPLLSCTAMLLVKPHGSRGSHFHRTHAHNHGDDAVCADLNNHETYFTVRVEVGTPAQHFSLIADTGSDSVIIPSCICVDSSACNTGKNDKCFRGTGHSSTFKIKDGPQGPPTTVLTFGSGQIEAAVATDVVRVAGVRAKMNNGLLLMTDQALSIDSAFQGILGLGPPKRDVVGMMVPAEDKPDASGHIVYSDGHAARQNLTAMGAARLRSRLPVLEGIAEIGSNSQNVPQVKNFLKEAGVKHFSVCYNDNGIPGALRLSTRPMSNTLKSMGGDHWSLNFHGVTIGGSNKQLDMCKGDQKMSDWETACVAVPDSGTTVLAAPKDHIVEILNHLCDEWPRCHSNHSTMAAKAETVHYTALSSVGWDPWHVEATSKAEVLVALLQDCMSWLDESKDGINELPPLRFHVAGRDGERRVLELPASSYIFEVAEEDMMAGNVSFTSRGSKREQAAGRVEAKPSASVCIPALEAIDYIDPKFGQMWILGMPFFYSYSVHYDLSEDEPAVGFESGACQTCNGDKKTSASLSQQDPQMGDLHGPRRRPRPLSQPIRLPQWVRKGLSRLLAAEHTWLSG
mmetsp:Transcript_67794/g.126618  ORF Transcript_67794/g.126618 Transcript_67794/m.126618 type:complete len:582 (-) Transcript_67794:46-1791(-)